jgi:hypothetical protein
MKSITDDRLALPHKMDENAKSIIYQVRNYPLIQTSFKALNTLFSTFDIVPSQGSTNPPRQRQKWVGQDQGEEVL